MSGHRTSDYYKTQNLPERFDNPENVNSQKQICYMPGNPVFSCVNPPPSISNNLYINEDEEILKGYPEKPINPMFRTTNGDYGGKRPNVHTMPTSYHSRSSGFTEHLGKTGMYRNQGLNTALSRSKV